MNEFNNENPLAPHMMEDGPEQTPEFASFKPKSKVSAQTIVLVAVLVIGSGLLFAMRRLGMGPGSSIAGIKIEYEPGKSGSADRVDNLLASLDRLDDPVQVPEYLVTRNPFMLDIEAPVEDTPTTAVKPTGPDQATRNAQQRRLDLQKRFDQLKIQSIIGGRVPLAKINGETVTVGDAVADFFTVKAISGRSVTLTADDESYTLFMGESDVGSRTYNK